MKSFFSNFKITLFWCFCFFLLSSNTIFANFKTPTANNVELFTNQEKTTVFHAKIKRSLLDFIFLKSPKLIFRDFSEYLPNKFNKALGVYSPISNILVNRPNLVFKGYNKYLMPTYINGIPVNIREDGRFFYDFNLNNKSKNIVVISLVTPDFEVINLIRKIIYLPQPPKDISLYKKNRNFIIYYLNSSYLNPSQNVSSLSQAVTRADLAYFIYKLKSIKSGKSIKTPLFVDVPADYWAAPAIKYALEKNIMLEYPDGKFYPEKAVTEIEYIITLIRAYNFQGLDYNIKLPYKNIDLDHWTTKYIKIAYKKGLIPKRDALDIYRPLKLGDFISLVCGIQKIKAEVLKVQNFNDFKLNSKEKNDIVDKIRKDLRSYQQASFKNQKIEFYQPFDQALFLDPQVVFKGKISPPSDFKINKKVIKPDIEGNFTVTFNSTKKTNNFRINAFNEKYVLTTYFLPSFIDLQNHWIQLTAAKLKGLGLFGKDQLFTPNKQIRRYELASYMKHIFSLKNENKKVITFSDLGPKNNTYSDLKLLVDNGILKIDKDGKIYPYRMVTNLEAILAITRLVNASEEGELPRLRFRNIPKNHWAYKTLQLAVREGIISNKRYLNCNKKITKAELIALFAKTPYLREKLGKIFQR